MSVPVQTLNNFLAMANTMLPIERVHYWQRGTVYDTSSFDHIIDHVDAFVIILPDNSFKHALATLTSGTQKEVLRATSREQRGKSPVQLYIGYLAGVNKIPTFYAAKIVDGCIEGIQGTKFNFPHACTRAKNLSKNEVSKRGAPLPTILVSEIMSKLDVSKNEAIAIAKGTSYEHLKYLLEDGHQLANIREFKQKRHLREQAFKETGVDIDIDKPVSDNRILLLKRR